MSARTITGLKIRERRRAVGLRQNELARRVGISPSYLNLIERNKRAIGGALLGAIGRELSLSVGELDGTAERRLRGQLVSLSEDPAAGSVDMRGEDIDAFIARSPGWARGAARLYAAWRAADAEVEALSDRLTHDPVLAETLHAMLTEITALRSIAEILADPRGIEPAQRQRFERIVDEQSARLARTATALVAHFDELSEARRPLTAQEEAEEFLHRASPGAAIEAAAERLRADLDRRSADLETALASAHRHPLPADWGRARRLGHLALAFARTADAPEIDAVLAPSPADALPHARAALGQRLADAILLPAAGFVALGQRLRWETGALVRALDGDGATAFRRIAALAHAGAPRVALLVADASGRTLERGGALELLPRARQLDCPVWPLHRARADRVDRALVELAGGEARLVEALARPDGMARDMLVSAAPAGGADAALPRLAVGSGCRVCTHRLCAQRRELSVVDD